MLWGDEIVTFDFNPRTHEECDGLAYDGGALRQNFNPRTHEECDFSNCKMTTRKSKFQSTHSRGVRHGRAVFRNYTTPDFNPRTHEECDAFTPF